MTLTSGYWICPIPARGCRGKTRDADESMQRNDFDFFVALFLLTSDVLLIFSLKHHHQNHPSGLRPARRRGCSEETSPRLGGVGAGRCIDRFPGRA